MPVFGREAEFRRKLGANGFSKQQGDAATALLVESDLKRTSDGCAAGVVEAGQEDY